MNNNATMAKILAEHEPGDEASVNDADGNIYWQDRCSCGAYLGMHLSLATHQAEALTAAGVNEVRRDEA